MMSMSRAEEVVGANMPVEAGAAAAMDEGGLGLAFEAVVDVAFEVDVVDVADIAVVVVEEDDVLGGDGMFLTMYVCRVTYLLLCSGCGSGCESGSDRVGVAERGVVWCRIGLVLV